MRIGGERFAAGERAERRIDDASLRARNALRKLGAGTELDERRGRAVDQPLDEAAASRSELALDAARGTVERRDVARRIVIAGGRECFRCGGVVGSGGHAGAAEYNQTPPDSRRLDSLAGCL